MRLWKRLAHKMFINTYTYAYAYICVSVAQLWRVGSTTKSIQHECDYEFPSVRFISVCVRVFVGIVVVVVANLD